MTAGKTAFFIHTINKDMKSTFLTTEQITKLAGIEWDVIPNCAYITIYPDDLPYVVRTELCQNLGISPDVFNVKILCIATQTS